MKISCKTAKDIMSLGIRKKCSRRREIDLKEHMKTCRECRIYYQQMWDVPRSFQKHTPEKSIKITREELYLLKIFFQKGAFYFAIFIFWLSYLIFISGKANNTIFLIFSKVIGLGKYGIPLFMGLIFIRFLFRKKSKKNILWFAVYFTVFIIHLAGTNYAFNFYECSGYVVIDQKKVIGDNWYLYVKDGKGNPLQLKCLKDNYREINIDEETAYQMSYRYNSITNIGKVLFIQPEDVKMVPK